MSGLWAIISVIPEVLGMAVMVVELWGGASWDGAAGGGAAWAGASSVGSSRAVGASGVELRRLVHLGVATKEGLYARVLLV